MKYVIAVGSPFNGIELYGPFENREAAYKLVDALNMEDITVSIILCQRPMSLEFMYGFKDL